MRVPTKSDYAAYRVSDTKYTDIPYDRELSWPEWTIGGGTLYQRFDLHLPTTPRPLNGYPVAVWMHPNGQTKTVSPGGGVDNNVLQPLLAAGFAVAAIEFRHPVTNKAEVPQYMDAYNDPGRAVQAVRAACSAFGLNAKRVGAVCQSRGSLMFYACLFDDLADPYADTYAGTQSSKVSALWIRNGQTLHRSATAAELFVLPAERAAFVATNPDNPEMRDALLLLAESDYFPKVYLSSEDAYHVGLQTAATVTASYVHYPDMLKELRDRYIALGQGSLVQAFDAVPDETAFVGMPAWLSASLLSEEAEVTNFYVRGANRVHRDVGTGPDTPVFTPKLKLDLTSDELASIKALANGHPLRVAVEAQLEAEGTPITSAGAQAVLTKHHDEIAANGKTGKGGVLEFIAGEHEFTSLLASKWSKLTARGAKGGTILKLKHTLTSGQEGALIEFRNDFDQSNSVSGIGEVSNLCLSGDSANAAAGAIEHGVWLPEAVDTDDSIVMTNTLIADFSGNGLDIGKKHNQFRGQNIKSVDNKGYAVKLNKTSDVKIDMLGAGRSGLGQIYAIDCASLQITKFDTWTPGAGKFTGLYAANFESCRLLRMVQGEIQGILNFDGDNSTVGNATRYQTCGNMVLAANLKISPETHAGTQYTGGGGAITYDTLVRMRSASGVHFGFCTFGGSSGELSAEELAAQPKYIWDIAQKGGGAASEKGYAVVTSCDLLHNDRTVSTDAPQTAFKLHWAKDPATIVWRTDKPGELKILPTATSQVNLLMLTGVVQNISRAKYPLCYLGQNDANKLTDAGTTFPVPAAAGTLPAGYSWFVVLW